MKDSAFHDFSEAAQDALDFARCQRADGSYYGTGGQCRKGALVDPREKKQAKAKKETELTPKKAAKVISGIVQKGGGMDSPAMDADDVKDFLEELEESHERYPSDSFITKFKEATTDQERLDVAQRAAAEYNDEVLFTSKIYDAQTAGRAAINKAIKTLQEDEDDQGTELGDVAYDILERAGYKNPTEKEAENLAASWVGNEPGGFRSW